MGLDLQFRLLAAKLEQNGVSLDNVGLGEHGSFPFTPGIKQLLAEYDDLKGNKAIYTHPRILEEIIGHVRKAQGRVRKQLNSLARYHRNELPSQFHALRSIEKDAVFLVVALSGILDSLLGNFKQHWSRPQIKEIKRRLLCIYPINSVQRCLAHDSALFSSDFIEISLVDLAGESWESVDLLLSESFLKCATESNDEPPATLQPLYNVIEPTDALDDVVLPTAVIEQVRSLCAHFKEQEFDNRKPNLTFLFSGPPGTGKSMAAKAIARELGRNAMKVVFSNVPSRLIPKAVAYLSVLAQRRRCVLIFDECEDMLYSIFGPSDSWGKEFFETFRGVAIFTTNHRGHIPYGFDRRITYSVKFRAPNAKARQTILAQELSDLRDTGMLTHLPPPQVIAELANRFPLPGGYLRPALQLALARSLDSTETASNRKHLDRAALNEAFSHMQVRVDSTRSDEIVEAKVNVKDLELSSGLQNDVNAFAEYAAKVMTSEPPISGKLSRLTGRINVTWPAR